MKNEKAKIKTAPSLNKTPPNWRGCDGEQSGAPPV